MPLPLTVNAVLVQARGNVDLFQHFFAEICTFLEKRAAGNVASMPVPGVARVDKKRANVFGASGMAKTVGGAVNWSRLLKTIEYANLSQSARPVVGVSATPAMMSSPSLPETMESGADEDNKPGSCAWGADPVAARFVRFVALVTDCSNN